jgi:hypothetical protein
MMAYRACSGGPMRFACTTVVAVAAMLSFAPRLLVAQSHDFDDWQGFAPGSWCKIRTISETLDDKGAVVGTTTSTTSFKLERVEEDAVTVDVLEGTVEYAGKTFSTPAAKLVLRPFGRSEKEKIDFDEQPTDAKPDEAEQGDSDRSVKAVITGDEGKREVTAVFRDASLRLPVRRIVKSFDAKGEPVATTTTDLFVPNVPFPVRRGFRSTTYYRTHYRNHKLTSTTVVAKSTDVPGQLLYANAIERDASGRVFRRTSQELIEYYAVKQPAEGISYNVPPKQRRQERRERRQENRLENRHTR